MDSKGDLMIQQQPLLSPDGGKMTTDHSDTKEIEIETIELQDTDALRKLDDVQKQTIQVSESVTVDTDHNVVTKKKEKRIKNKTKSNITPLTFGLNLNERDQKEINGQVHIMFDDIIGEPEGTHSFEPVFRSSYVLFNLAKLWLYRIIGAIIALPLALVWGLVFGLLALANVWICTPAFKLFSICIFWFGRFWGAFFRGLVDPIFESVGRCFSGIRVNSPPTEPYTGVTNDYSKSGAKTNGSINNVV